MFLRPRVWVDVQIRKTAGQEQKDMREKERERESKTTHRERDILRKSF